MALSSQTILRELDAIDFDASFGSSANAVTACTWDLVSSQRSEDSFTFSEDDFDVILAAERSKRPLSLISPHHSDHTAAFLSPCKRSAPRYSGLRMALLQPQMDLVSTILSASQSTIDKVTACNGPDSQSSIDKVTACNGVDSQSSIDKVVACNGLDSQSAINKVTACNGVDSQSSIDKVTACNGLDSQFTIDKLAASCGLKSPSNLQLTTPQIHVNSSTRPILIPINTNAFKAPTSPRRNRSTLPVRRPGSTGLTSPSKGRNSFIPPRPIIQPKHSCVVPAAVVKSESPPPSGFTSRVPVYPFRTFEPPQIVPVRAPAPIVSNSPQLNAARPVSPNKMDTSGSKDLARFAYLPPFPPLLPPVKSEPGLNAGSLNTTVATPDTPVSHELTAGPADTSNTNLRFAGFVAPTSRTLFTAPSNSFDLSAKMQNITATRLFKTSAANPTKRSSDPYPSIQLATQKPDTTTLQDPNALKKVKPIILSAEQEYVLRQALDGTSLFFTGSAGTGKSVLLRQIIKALKTKHSEVAVTASTGLAACNIRGITLHSFAGVGLAKEPVDTLMKKLRRNRKALARWHTTKVLVIDEVSMVDGDFLNKLDAIGKKVRKNQRPFGGIQIIMCGDFYQLPPVVKNTASDGSSLSQPPEAFFAFESEAWKSCVSQTIILEEVFRQKGDQVFIDMLNELRNGSVSDVTAHNFAALLRPLKCPQGIVPAELFATRLEVDRANNTRLHQIKGPAKVYTSIDTGTLSQPQLLNVLSNFLAGQKLFLKVGAQVMCIKNYDETLVNGSLGQVIDFVDKNTYMKGLEADGVLPDEKMCTSDYVFDKKDKKTKPKSDKAKAPGLLAMAKAKETSDARKEALGEDIKNDTTQHLHPLVKFLLPDGVNSRTVLVEPEQWTVEDEKQVVLASRVQLPLILAWSLSIHKSQGQTLPKVKVDLKNVFETGQSYVALSRAVSRTGLQVLNFNASKVRSHPRVKEFYRTLEPAAQAMRRPRGQIKLSFARA